MNITMWILAGGILGCIAYSYLGFNEERGLIVSIIIGSIGGFFGGNVLAPALGSPAAIPGEFNMVALFFAAAVASAFLFAGSVLDKRWGI